jgi:vacuolar-type H+-ATPase subunit E/Vma4
MSKEGLIATLQAETNREIERQLQEVTVRIQKLDENFARDQDEHLKKARTLAKQLAENEKERLLETQQTRSAHDRQDLYWQVLNQMTAAVEEKLGHLREQESVYRPLFAFLLKEAIAQLRKNNPSLEKIEVQIDDRDSALFESLDGDLQIELRKDLSSQGGMIVHDREGGMLIDNRLEARLERARDVFIQEWLPELAILFQDGS